MLTRSSAAHRHPKKRRTALALRWFAAPALFLALSSCGGAGGGGAAPHLAPTGSFDLTGLWTGSWSSDVNTGEGTVDLFIAHRSDGLRIDGSVSVRSGNGCFFGDAFSSGVATARRIRITGRFFALDLAPADSEPERSPRALAGTYSVTEGGCAGDKGSIRLNWLRPNRATVAGRGPGSFLSPWMGLGARLRAR